MLNPLTAALANPRTYRVLAYARHPCSVTRARIGWSRVPVASARASLSSHFSIQSRSAIAILCAFVKGKGGGETRENGGVLPSFSVGYCHFPLYPCDLLADFFSLFTSQSKGTSVSQREGMVKKVAWISPSDGNRMRANFGLGRSSPPPLPSLPRYGYFVDQMPPATTYRFGPRLYSVIEHRFLLGSAVQGINHLSSAPFGLGHSDLGV